MYCNKVKKGKYCITYTLQLNLAKLNLDRSSSARRIFQYSPMSKLSHVLAVSQLAWVHTSPEWNWDTRIGWVTVAWFQMASSIRLNSSSECPQTPPLHLGALMRACSLRWLSQHFLVNTLNIHDGVFENVLNGF